ncbi:MAG: agmatinase [Planctomycetes bacterium]|nr:agmatinase [Planctomycetota bacterium]
MTDSTVRETVNFGDLPRQYSEPADANVVIVPVAYDGTSTWVKGADKGPAAIIEASANMELYDIETDSQVYKKGIFTDEPVTEKDSPERMVEAVKAVVGEHLGNGKFVVTIGGEHSVSVGAIEAYSQRLRNFCVLQLDAHSDLRSEYEDLKYNHACVMARVKEICPIVQVGIRSMDSSEKEAMDKSRVFFAEDIYNEGDWMEKAVSLLCDNVYVTIDLDVFDPSIMPSTGTPEPGGLLWYDVLKLLRTVCGSKNVVGFDVTELCPEADNKSPDFMAAKLIYKFLSYKFETCDG